MYNKLFILYLQIIQEKWQSIDYMLVYCKWGAEPECRYYNPERAGSCKVDHIKITSHGTKGRCQKATRTVRMCFSRLKYRFFPNNAFAVYGFYVV